MIIKKIIYSKTEWHVAFKFTDQLIPKDLHKSIIIKNPKGGYLADPFLYKYKGINYCFVENYNYKENRGKISTYELNRKGYLLLGDCLDKFFHLSYPFIFKYKNKIYMCPETHQLNEIRIYECEKFPLKWKFYNTLIDNITAADTNIFFKNNKWWLITSVSNKEHLDFCKTHIYSSNNPLSSKWILHKSNPIIFDPFKARNAGLIINNKNYYRISQKNGFLNYGESLSINKINKIDTNSFNESHIKELKADYFENINGTHTLNFNNEVMVFDFSNTKSIIKNKKL